MRAADRAESHRVSFPSAAASSRRGVVKGKRVIAIPPSPQSAPGHDDAVVETSGHDCASESAHRLGFGKSPRDVHREDGGGAWRLSRPRRCPREQPAMHAEACYHSTISGHLCTC